MDARRRMDIRQIDLLNEPICILIWMSTRPGEPLVADRITRVNTYDISTDPSRLDLDAIHDYLVRSYWSPGIPKSIVARAIAHSMCFGIYLDDAQVGFAR